MEQIDYIFDSLYCEICEHYGEERCADCIHSPYEEKENLFENRIYKDFWEWEEK